MKLVFVHGWSVTDIGTYGQLPEVLERESYKYGLDLEIENIYLGEYISFHDEVTLDDISRAFEFARKEKFADESFACITHSTGGPVIRLWIDLFFKDKMNFLPLTHLIMLAPANHGSSLAALGKAKVGRIKSWLEDIEPGIGVLNWLALGSQGQWKLNSSWLDYNFENSFYPFVLSGEKIDRHFYDFLNSYLVEEGSDGVVRLAGANLNYQKVVLEQSFDDGNIESRINKNTFSSYPLKLRGNLTRTNNCAFEVVNSASHSGNRYGIMNSVRKNRKVKPVVGSILEALQVRNFEQYEKLSNLMKKRSDLVQSKNSKYLMLVFSIEDNLGNRIKDYDMLLLGGKDYEPHIIPKGFFIDKQKNKDSGNLVYYVNHDKLINIKDGKIGIRIIARPNEGFVHYEPAEFHLEDISVLDFLKANETIMIKVILKRNISSNTFLIDKFGESKTKNGSFKYREASKKYID